MKASEPYFIPLTTNGCEGIVVGGFGSIRLVLDSSYISHDKAESLAQALLTAIRNEETQHGD